MATSFTGVPNAGVVFEGTELVTLTGGVITGTMPTAAVAVKHSPFVVLPSSDDEAYGLPLAGVYTDAKQ